MNLQLESHIMEDQFHDMEKLVYYTVHKFIARYGGCFSDLVEHAGLAFVVAYKTYDPEHGATFATYVRSILWYHLLSHIRKEIKLHSRIMFTELDADQYSTRDFFLFEFLECLGTDAQKVVKLVLQTPPGMRNRIVNKKPARIRKELRDHLKALGWTKNRIVESFLEIRKALQ